MTDDVTTRAIAERLQSWSRTMVLGADTFTSLTRMAEAMDAVATRLLELLPAADDAVPLGVAFIKASIPHRYTVMTGRAGLVHGDLATLSWHDRPREFHLMLNGVCIPWGGMTRGEFRALARAYRVTLTEPKS